MRQIFLCINSAGSTQISNDRIIEVAAVEIENRELTGRRFHCYINPLKEIEEQAIVKHGITTESLLGKPLFNQIADD